MKEKEAHLKAFETYFEMGPTRSLSKLSDRLGISRSALRDWSMAFRWQERIDERGRDVAKVMASRSIRTEAEDRSKQRQLVQLALVTVARQIAEGRVRGNMGDLDRLIRLERFLEGEADSRQEVIARELKGKSPEELREMLRREITELADLTGEEGPAAN
jgi:hypothetical protein